MSTDSGLRNIIQSIQDAPQRAIHFISGAVTRIFGPTDDNYPATGVQPFEGDSANEKSR